jgi:uncharacterized protein with NRDE domain
LVRLKVGLQTQLKNGRIEVRDLLPLLQDKTIPLDAALPNTGVPLELERMLSSAFVSSQLYGTRASSIVTMGRKQTCFFEQSCDARGTLVETQQFFTL